MKKSSNYIVILAIGCLLLVILFALKGYNKSSKMVEAKVLTTNFSFDMYEKEITKNISEENKIIIDNYKNKQASDANYSDSLFYFWAGLKHPEIGSYYLLSQKDTINNDSLWLRAGEGFYTGGLSQSDSDAYTYFLLKSKAAFDKAYTINPNNLDARYYKAITTMAIVSIDDRVKAMESIPELLQIIQIDSNHVPTLYTLGLMGIESAQYDKALHRFEKLISLQPFNAELYLYVGEIYLKKGDKTAAKIQLEKAKKLARNSFVLQSIEELLKETN